MSKRTRGDTINLPHLTCIPIPELIKLLQQYENLENAEFDVDYSEYAGYEFVIYYSREETEEECKQRLEKETVKKEAALRIQREEYERLKALFEKEEKE